MLSSLFQVLFPLLLLGVALSIVGLPVALWSSYKLEEWDRRIAVASAPLWGIAILALIGSLAERIGLPPRQWNTALLALSIVGAIGIPMIRGSRKNFATEFSVCLITLTLVITLTLLINGDDLTQVGSASYFPLTNADTFNYLGYIEQLREVGSYAPRLVYPDGTSIDIERAIHIRLGCAAVVASLLNIIGIDTAQGFFLSLRIGLALAVLGVTLVAAAVTRRMLAPFSVAVIAIGGNLLLPQILQQFLSSVLGLSQLAIVVLAAIWAARNDMRLPSVVLLGFSVGTYALVTPESHPLIVIVLLAVFSMAVLPIRGLISSAIAVSAFLAGYVLVIGPFAAGYFPELFGQLKSTTHHPGDFFAAPGAILYAAGITVWDGRSIDHYENYERFIAFATVIAYALAAFGCVAHAMLTRSRAIAERQIALLLGIAGCAILAAQAFAYATGRGFLLEKLSDYYTFFLLVGVFASITYCISWLENAVVSHWLRRFLQRVIWTLALGGVGLYLYVTFSHKEEILARYVRIIKSSPSADDYRAHTAELEGVTGLWADLGDDVMNRFLWENRWQSTPLYVPSKPVLRFSSGIPLSSVSHMLRMSGAAVGTSTVVDINRPRDADMNSRVQIVPARNYLRIIEGTGWLGPEGATAAVVWRWLYNYGDFMVLAPCTENKVLMMQLTPGPDTDSANNVEVYLNDQRLAVVHGNELLKDGLLTRKITLPPMCRSNPVQGSIFITGPMKGHRQVRIGALYIAALDNGRGKTTSW